MVRFFAFRTVVFIFYVSIFIITASDINYHHNTQDADDSVNFEGNRISHDISSISGDFHVSNLGPGTIDPNTGIFTPSPIPDPTYGTITSFGIHPTTSKEQLKIVRYSWKGSASCGKGDNVPRETMEFYAGGECRSMFGAGGTEKVYYQAKCRGSMNIHKGIDFDEQVSIEYYEDAKCRKPRTFIDLYKQRTCLKDRGVRVGSEVYFCEKGVAECHMCLNNSASSISSFFSVSFLSLILVSLAFLYLH